MLVAPLARQQIGDVAEYYLRETDDHDLVVRLLAQFEDALLALTTMPRRFRADEVVGFRRIYLRNFPIVVWFSADDESTTVTALAVTHARMGSASTSTEIRQGQ